MHSQIAKHFAQKNSLLADAVSGQKAALHLARELHAETPDEELEESAGSCGEPHPSSAPRQDAEEAGPIDDKYETSRGWITDWGDDVGKSNGNSVYSVSA